MIADVASMDHDLALESGAHGLDWLGADAAPLSCDDWFGSGGTAVSGGAPAGITLTR